MRNRTSYDSGVFCWIDLATSDPAPAAAFYAELFGWAIEDPGPSGYAMARLGEDIVAGMVTLPYEGPTRWQSYVSVESADDAAHRAQAAGAEVVAEPQDAGPAGRFAELRDPAGAIVSVWEAGDSPGAARVNQPGALCWNDLMTTDVEGAVGFYGDLFGWSLTAVDGAPGNRHSISAGGTLNGGVAEAAPGQPASWLACFAVEDAPASLAVANGAGGQAVTDVIDLPTGRFVVALDPQGAAFGLIDGEMDP